MSGGSKAHNSSKRNKLSEDPTNDTTDLSEPSTTLRRKPAIKPNPSTVSKTVTTTPMIDNTEDISENSFGSATEENVTSVSEIQTSLNSLKDTFTSMMDAMAANNQEFEKRYSDMAEQIKNLETENTVIKNEVLTYKNNVHVLKNFVLRESDMARAHQLLVINLKEAEGKTKSQLYATLINFFNSHIQCNHDDVKVKVEDFCTAHRLGKPKTNMIRSIIVEFITKDIKVLIMAHAKRLAGLHATQRPNNIPHTIVKLHLNPYHAATDSYLNQMRKLIISNTVACGYKAKDIKVGTVKDKDVVVVVNSLFSKT